MSVIMVLITASFAMAIIFLVLFIWAIKSGQFEDDYTPSVRILIEDDQGQNAGKENVSI